MKCKYYAGKLIDDLLEPGLDRRAMKRVKMKAMRWVRAAETVLLKPYRRGSGESDSFLRSMFQTPDFHQRQRAVCAVDASGSDAGKN